MDTGTLAAMGYQQIVPVVFDEEAYRLTASAWRDFMEDIARAEILVEQSKKL